jgi:RNA polymerase sigma factor (sigma-70 family)
MTLGGVRVGVSLASETKNAFLATIEKAYGRQLRRYLSARMRNAASDVPDLVQEVFLRLLRVERHEAIRNPQAYLYTIASHVLHQHALRKTAAPESIELADVASELEAIPDSDPELQAERDQRFEELRRGLRQISPGAYATLLLHRYYGLPLTDISERLGVSYSMTKKYLAKALKYIEKLREEGREGP